MKKLSWDFLRKFFALRTHGNNLLSPGTEQWMFIARIVVLIMAVVESLSWGYLGSLLGNDENKASRYIMAGVVGGFIFLIVWMVDITLMTLDRYKRYYHRRIFPLEEAESKQQHNFLTSFIKENDVQISIVFRIMMVAMSMVITAPFLNQLIFQKEISAVIDRKQKLIIETRKKEILSTYAAPLVQAKHKIDSLENRYHQEVSGKGLTKRIGEGPSAKSLRKLIEDQNNLISQIKADKEAELQDYDHAVQSNDYGRLEAKWNLILPSNSLTERGIAIEELMKSADIQLTETAIKSFLCFLFLAMLLLKFFEPHGVRIYLSEALQQAYLSYQSGGFNKWLRIEEQANGKSPMQPFRFEEFMVNIYPKFSKDEKMGIQDKAVHDRVERIEKAIELIQENRIRLEDRVSASRNEIQSEITTIDVDLKETETLMANLEEQLKQLSSKLDQHEHETLEMETKRSTLNGHSGQARVLIAETLQHLTHSKINLNADIHRVGIQIKQAQLRLNNLKTQKMQAFQRLQQIDAPLVKINEELQALQDALIKTLVNGALD